MISSLIQAKVKTYEEHKFNYLAEYLDLFEK